MLSPREPDKQQDEVQLFNNLKIKHMQ